MIYNSSEEYYVSIYGLGRVGTEVELEVVVEIGVEVEVEVEVVGAQREGGFIPHIPAASSKKVCLGQTYRLPNRTSLEELQLINFLQVGSADISKRPTFPFC